MTKTSTFRGAGILGALALAASGGALAQGGGYGGGDYNQAPPQQQQAQQDFSEHELEAFAEAQPAIESISEEYASRLNEVEDPQKAAELRQEVNQEMVAAVTDTGIDVGTYNAIAQAMTQDPELAERVESMQ